VYLGELMCWSIWMDREVYKAEEAEAFSDR
jgi:hypothetical protein